MIPKLFLLGFSKIDRHQLIRSLAPFGGTRGDVCRSYEMRRVYVSSYLNSSERQTDFCELLVKASNEVLLIKTLEEREVLLTGNAGVGKSIF